MPTRTEREQLAGELDPRPVGEPAAKPDPLARSSPPDAGRRVASGPANRRHRWRWWVGALGLVFVLVVGLEAIPGVTGHDQSALLSELAGSDAGTVVSRLNPFAHDQAQPPCAMLDSTFGTGNHLFKNRRFGFYASVWPTYQALTALYVTSILPGNAACSAAFDQTVHAVNDNYWDESPPGSTAAYDQGPSAFHFRSDLPRVDDSLWMGLADLQDYARSRDPASLHRAEAVFRLARANWAPGGGVYWEATGTDNHTRAVVSNAPAAVLGVELYFQTRDRSDLTWSERMLDWISTALWDPATRLYDDSLDDHGGHPRVTTTKYTYTEGMMVGAIAVLSLVDPARYPVGDAVGLAERSMTYFDAHRSYGQPGFDLIWVENLLWTAAVVHNPAFSGEVVHALQRALTAEPRRPSDLLTTSSELALRQLARLPPGQDARLLYLTRPVSSRSVAVAPGSP